MNVELISDNISAIAFVSHRCNVTNGRASALTLHVNMKYYADLDVHDVNGSATCNRGNIRAGYLDRTLAHELTHGIGEQPRQTF